MGPRPFPSVRPGSRSAHPTHMPPPRSFPSPWSVIEIPGGYRVDDASGNRLGYFYFWDDPAGRYHADVLSPEEARRMAEDFATLPLRL